MIKKGLNGMRNIFTAAKYYFFFYFGFYFSPRLLLL